MPEFAPLASLLRNLATIIAEGGGGSFQTARGLAPGLGTPYHTLATVLRKTPLVEIVNPGRIVRPTKREMSEAATQAFNAHDELRSVTPLLKKFQSSIRVDPFNPWAMYTGLYRSTPDSKTSSDMAHRAVRYFAESPKTGGVNLSGSGGPIAVRLGGDYYPLGHGASPIKRHEVSHALADYLSRLQGRPPGWLDRVRAHLGSAKLAGGELGPSAKMLDEIVATASGGRSALQASDLLHQFGQHHMNTYLDLNRVPPGRYRKYFEGPVRFALLSEPSSLTGSPKSLAAVLGRLADEAQKHNLAVGGLGLGGLGAGLAAE